jgi:V8-like Glu-specific endopeptidase
LKQVKIKRRQKVHNFSKINGAIFALGRQTPTGVQLLGTCLLTHKEGILATASHVVGHDDSNLVGVLKPFPDKNSYQDTSDNQCQIFPLKLHSVDTVHDLCLLESKTPIASNVQVGGADEVEVGTQVSIFGYPHADHGRLVLTEQTTEIGARILISSGTVKVKHVVLNIQSRPGQSGSPIFNRDNGRVVAILVGSYAPTGGSGISLGGVDPHTLHQTTHAVSAEYLGRML